MRNRVGIPVLVALVLLLALVQFVWARPLGSPFAQATASITAQATAEAATTPTGTETPLPPPERGCYGCHVQIDPDGRFTLAWEAMERMEAQGKSHPELPLDTAYETCLTCHNATVAKRFSSIVHPAHMFSPIFSEEFRGNCFSCHEVAEDELTVLVDKQNVNDKGVIQPTPTGTPPTATPTATPQP